jgi:hypothetical protein
MNAFAAAIEMLFADPNIGAEAIYTSDGGTPVLVRAVARRADGVSEFSDARLWSETTRTCFYNCSLLADDVKAISFRAYRRVCDGGSVQKGTIFCWQSGWPKDAITRL